MIDEIAGAVGIGGQLLGVGGQNINTNQNTNTKQTTNEFIQQLVNQLQKTDTIEKQAGSTSTLTGAQQADISSLIGQLTKQLTGEAPTGVNYAGVRDSAVLKVLEEGIGNIIAAGSNQGAYASTPQATAAERLGSRAAVEGANAEATVRLQEQGQLQGAISNLLSILKGATTNVDLENATQGNVSTTSDTTSRSTADTVATTGTKTKQDVDNKGLLDRVGIKF